MALLLGGLRGLCVERNLFTTSLAGPFEIVDRKSTARRFDRTRELRVPGDELFGVFAVERLPELFLDHGRVGDRFGREVIVRVEIKLLHESPRRVGGF